MQAKRGKYDRRMFTLHGVDPNVNPGCRAAAVRAYAAYLIPTDTLRPVGSSPSYHARRNGRGQGQGIDFGNVAGKRPGERGWATGRRRLVRFQAAEHARARREAGRIERHDLVELIGPDNRLTILRGQETDLSEGTALETQHDNHVHEAYAD